MLLMSACSRAGTCFPFFNSSLSSNGRLASPWQIASPHWSENLALPLFRPHAHCKVIQINSQRFQWLSTEARNGTIHVNTLGVSSSLAINTTTITNGIRIFHLQWPNYFLIRVKLSFKAKKNMTLYIHGSVC